MRMFDDARPSFSTKEWARKKLVKTVGGENALKKYRWLIAVKSDGRYVPVITGAAPDVPYMQFATVGICCLG